MPANLFNQILLLAILITSGSQCLANIKKSIAINGKIEFNHNNACKSDNLFIHGQWKYFPDTLIPVEKITSAFESVTSFNVNVPSKKKDLKGSKYGTYYLNITCDSGSRELVLNTLTIYASAKVFLNGSLIASIGNPNTSIESNKPALMLKTWPFKLKKGCNKLVVHYANFSREKSGIANSISFTTPHKKRLKYIWQIIKYGIILGTLLFIIFTQINYYLLRRKSKISLIFGLATLCIFMYIVFMSQYYFSDILTDFNPNFVVTVKLWRIVYYATVALFTLYVSVLFKESSNNIILFITLVYCTLSGILTLFFPLHISSMNFNYFMLFTIIIGLYLTGVGIYSAFKRVELSRLFVIGFAFFIATVINDILHNLLIIKSVNLLDVGIFGMMLTQAQIINIKLSRSLVQSEKLSNNLKYMNNNLEDIVRRRTNEIEEQKTEIESQRDQVENQNQLILQQTKTITDSINYAREIQRAVLPEEQSLKEHFNDSFILFKPKDFVSGDFYWIRHVEVNNEPFVIFCVADCTGHGVPGALLSMLGMTLLNEITNSNDFKDTADILEKLRIRFKETLANRTDYKISYDGMHITLCMVNKNTNKVYYSGAFQALYHIHQQEIKRYKGTRSIIGNYIQEKNFEEISFHLDKGDRLYLFTDGFADQISGKGEGRFMQKELLSLLISYENMPFDQQKEKLIEAFENWKSGFEQIDDVLVMGLMV